MKKLFRKLMGIFRWKTASEEEVQYWMDLNDSKNEKILSLNLEINQLYKEKENEKIIKERLLEISRNIDQRQSIEKVREYTSKGMELIELGLGTKKGRKKRKNYKRAAEAFRQAEGA